MPSGDKNMNFSLDYLPFTVKNHYLVNFIPAVISGSNSYFSNLKSVLRLIAHFIYNVYVGLFIDDSDHKTIRDRQFSWKRGAKKTPILVCGLLFFMQDQIIDFFLTFLVKLGVNPRTMSVFLLIKLASALNKKESSNYMYVKYGRFFVFY